MDELSQTPGPSIVAPANRVKMLDGQENFTSECRSLIRVLSYTIDSLCIDCDGESINAVNIRSLISSLNTMKSLVSELENKWPVTTTQDFFEDTNGTRYISVRNYETECFSAK